MEIAFNRQELLVYFDEMFIIKDLLVFFLSFSHIELKSYVATKKLLILIHSFCY
jgi:hypothetical protein